MEKRASEPMEEQPTPKKEKKIRVYVDGCFDILHFGHANALRQAKALGDVLVAGVHSNEEIERYKGPPVMNLDERVKMVKAIKWVDEVVENVPYTATVQVLDDNNCDFGAHGDDIIIVPGGNNCYQDLIDAGRFKIFKRTQGVSTTDLVGRMLLMTKEHFTNTENEESADDIKSPVKKFANENPLGLGRSPYTGLYKFVPNTRRIIEFSDSRDPQPGDKVVYAAGDFDLFHVGHVDFLSKCLELGNYIIVGLHEDHVVNGYKGGNFPIMNLHERVLGALACRYVSNVVIGAPYKVDDMLLDYFKIDYVVHGRTPVKPCLDGSDPYEAARKRGIFHTVDSGNPLTTNDIVKRIIDNRLKYMSRNEKKEKKEIDSINKQKKAE